MKKLILILVLVGCSNTPLAGCSNAPAEEEVTRCQNLLASFVETVDEAKKESKQAALETVSMAVSLYMLTDCADVIERARESGMVDVTGGDDGQ